ncbi:fam-a protein [Plasmodium vinckei brucechwatti]|uniref:Fam-a protein n=1 Tax=Plasmodium vinckei brucechwatti TaxID=119398 RepID=A0A6V7S5B8_PLAVN|nr:fam-a protein [Plasmodium vinckei brucechwatti]
MNKFYIQAVLFLLSVFVYASNEILAIDPAPEKKTTSKSKSRYPTSEEIYEKNKHVLCKCSTQARNAAKLMDEAAKHLEHHATDIDNYESCKAGPNVREFLYKKKHKGHTVIEKIQYTISDSNKYNETINKLWNSGTPNTFDKGSVKIVHMYNPNLVIIQQRYEKDSKGHQKYFYALAANVEISKDKTIIAMTSLGIKDRNDFRREYENPIMENVSSFYAYITPEDDIKNRELEKVLVNLAGYFIEKKGKNIEVTYIESIDGHASF